MICCRGGFRAGRADCCLCGGHCCAGDHCRNACCLPICRCALFLFAGQKYGVRRRSPRCLLFLCVGKGVPSFPTVGQSGAPRASLEPHRRHYWQNQSLASANAAPVAALCGVRLLLHTLRATFFLAYYKSGQTLGAYCGAAHIPDSNPHPLLLKCAL